MAALQLVYAGVFGADTFMERLCHVMLPHAVQAQ